MTIKVSPEAFDRIERDAELAEKRNELEKERDNLELVLSTVPDSCPDIQDEFRSQIVMIDWVLEDLPQPNEKLRKAMEEYHEIG